MPLVNHPYYTNSLELSVEYAMDEESNYDENFLLEDLFMKKKLFPYLKRLTVKCLHSFEKESFVMNSVKFSELKYLFASPHLRTLEELNVQNKAMNVSWKPLMLLSGKSFPNLRKITLPIHSIIKIHSYVKKTWNFLLDNTEIHLETQLANSKYYDSKLFNHYCFSWSRSPQHFLKDISTFSNSRSLNVDFSPDTPENPFNILEKLETYKQYEVENRFYFNKLQNFKILNLNKCKISTDFIETLCKIPETLYKRDDLPGKNYRKKQTALMEQLKENGYHDSYECPFEELRLQNNRITDSFLYHVSHSPVFKNLKVLDLRNNLIHSLSPININRHEVQLVNLKELYLGIINDHSQNIEYFFTGYPGRFLELGKL